MHSLSYSLLLASALASLASAGGVSQSTVNGRRQCTVTANGGTKDDVPNILKAFRQCGNGGNIVFPENQNYWIAQKLNPVVNDVRIDWKGIWTVSMPASTCRVKPV